MKPAQSLARLDFALLAALICLTIFARTLPGPRTIDDAFITFRYSRNIVEGNGFVYNLDSRVLGTTTPLFTVLMAVISNIVRGEDFPYYAMAVSALADAGTVALLFLLARRLMGNRWAGVLMGVLWAVAPRSVTFAIGGMETSLNIFWMIGAVYLYVIGREGWLGAFIALGVLTRIDAALWAGPLLAHQLILKLTAHSVEKRSALARLPWRTWLVGLAVAAPWLIFSLAYFGSPVPRSLTAKTVAYVMPPGSARDTFIQTYSTPFFEFDTFGPVGALIGFFAYMALAGIGGLYAARREPRLLPWLIYPWLYAIIFSIANPLIFRWYLAPPLPALFFSILCGVWAILGGLSRRRRVVRLIGLGAVAVLWIGTSLHAWTLHPDHGPDRPAPAMAFHLIELYYQRIATELREQYGVTPETRVASADIGAVGYFSNATIIDTVGLVTPALSRYYPIDPVLIAPGQNYAIPPALILDAKPAYFVTMEAFVRLGLEKDATFKADYSVIDEIPTTFYGTSMRLYQRR